MRSIATYFLTVLLVCTSLLAVTPSTGPATQPSEKAERQPGKLLLMRAAEPPGATRDRKSPVALLLCPTRQEEEFRKNWTSRLFRSGFCSVAAVMRESKWMAGHADVLIQDLDNIAQRSTMDLGRIVVIASGEAGVAGMELMDRYPKRLSGLVMISTAPSSRILQVTWPSSKSSRPSSLMAVFHASIQWFASRDIWSAGSGAGIVTVTSKGFMI